ncbi:uncharacterized protein [Ambystoma mexicanum]|uniref:uncharacterized protein isoform X1 n=1 Tax=Ambystoma mexicanum TaxID=8296 RepID=UPI0037E8441F
MKSLLVALWLCCLVSWAPTTEAQVDLSKLSRLGQTCLQLAVKAFNTNRKYIFTVASVEEKVIVVEEEEYVDLLFDLKETNCLTRDIQPDTLEPNNCGVQKQARATKCRACYTRSTEDDVPSMESMKCTGRKNPSKQALPPCEIPEVSVLHYNPGSFGISYILQEPTLSETFHETVYIKNHKPVPDEDLPAFAASPTTYGHR